MTMSRERLFVLAVATTGFGISTMMRKMAVDKIHPLHYQAIASVMYAFLIPAYVMLNNKYGDGGKVSTQGIMWTLGATAIHMIAATLFGIVLKSGNDTGIVTALTSASPVITLMISFAIFNEQPSFQGMIGMALVLVGVILMGR